MCGIVGFIDGTGSCTRDTLRDIAERMSATLRHRGPDDGDVWTDPGAGLALGHRRLSIIDLSPTGAQPMVSACGRYVIVFNGEIYNFQEVRTELISRGHGFRGPSDTEVILAAVSEWGMDNSLKRFNGMFAFALWDSVERVLHLARDRAGEKPLYYGWIGSSFAFASELKALRAHPDFRGSLNRDALALYIQRACVPAPHSIYEHIYKLPPACHLVYPATNPYCPSPTPYWSAKEAAEAGVASPFQGDSSEAITELGSLLRDAVRLRMIADVPLGAFLSGGIDSSAIVAMMQLQDPKPVKTFTIGFREPRYDEAQSARNVARHLGTEHTELYLTPEQALEVIPRLPALYDEPFADSSQIPTFLVSALARRHVTVSLSGDGGDELFGGYNLYKAGRLIWTTFGWMPSAWRRAIGVGLRTAPSRALNVAFLWLSPLQNLLGRNSSIGDKLHKLAPVLVSAEPELMRRMLVANWKDADALVLDSRMAATNGERPARLPDFIQHMMYDDLVTYLPDDILVKVDRASMGVGLEARVPFLDHRVIEFAWRLPLHFKLHGGMTKWILRQLLYRYVPRELVDRPKAGFSVPLFAWLRGSLREFGEDLLNESRLRQDGWFDAQIVRSLWSEHMTGHRNWEQPLWSILMFQAWLAQQKSCGANCPHDVANVATTVG